MTESEWLNCSDSYAMLDYLTSGSDRCFRLFACACARRIWHLLGDERSRQAVLVAERFADGGATRDELKRAHARAQALTKKLERETQWVACFAAGAAQSTAYCRPKRYSEFESRSCAVSASDSAVLAAASAANNGLVGEEANVRYAQGERSERAAQAPLLRDIFGNPLRAAVVPADSRRTATVLAAARRIYDSRAFEEMPVLADLLKAAGCDESELLGHLRDGGPHVLGCWAVDLILSKDR